MLHCYLALSQLYRQKAKACLHFHGLFMVRVFVQSSEDFLGFCVKQTNLLKAPQSCAFKQLLFVVSTLFSGQNLDCHSFLVLCYSIMNYISHKPLPGLIIV